MCNSHYEKFPDGTVKCIDEAIPFEVPQGWEWARVSTIFQLNPKNHADDNDPAGFIPMERIDATYLSSFSFAVKKWKEIKNGFTHFADGDVAVAKITPCFQNRKSMILQGLPNGIGAGTTELKVLRSYSDTISKEYLLFFLESPYFVEEASFKGTANQQRIISGYLENKLFPIPPRKEQDRIVAVIKSSFFVADRYDIAQNKLDHLNSSLNPLLKKSILQEAIQGKLVLQDPNDEPAAVLLERIQAKKLKLLKDGFLRKKDIVDSVIFKGDDNKYYEKVDGNVLDINDEIPFDIPQSWVWVRLQEICTYIHRGKSPKYSEIKKYPVIAQKCNQWEGFRIDKAQFISPASVASYSEDQILQDRDLLWNSTGLGTLGRIGLYPISKNPYGFAVADSHVTVIRLLKEYVRPEYLHFFLSSPTVQNVIEDKASGSTKQKELATETVKRYLCPLPPVNEQERIIDKVNTLIASTMRK